MLEDKYKKASEEISVYLIESVGNKTRIDYGTGKQGTTMNEKYVWKKYINKPGTINIE